MTGKHILILGAGIGGLVAAHQLRQQLSQEHHIILIDKEATHRLQSSYLWVMMGWRTPAAISRPLSALWTRGINFYQAEARHIDLAKRRVETSAGPIDYDYLVVALGAELVPEAIPGMAQVGITPYTLEGAVKLKEAWQRFEGGSLAIVISSTPFKCPAAPYEAALLLDSAFRKRGLRTRVNLQIYTPEPQPMPVAGPVVGRALTQMLMKRGIGYYPNTKVTAVDREERFLSFEGGGGAAFDLLLYIPPHRSPAVVRESGLAGETGWIPVQPYTLETGREGVYAIGDVAAVKLPNGMMLPKAGVFAHGEAEVVAHRISATVQGKQDGVFDGWGACFIEVGDGKAAYGSGSFFAEPAPQVKLQELTRSRHLGKVLFEKAWLAAVGGSRSTTSAAFWTMDFWGRTLLEKPWLWRWV